MGIDLVETTTKALTEPIIQEIRPVIGLYPSSASIVLNGKVEGSCLRKAAWDLMSQERTNPPSGNACMNMEMGNVSHNLVVELCKKERIYVAHEVPIFWPDVGISARPDLFVMDSDGSIVGVEIKSVHGHYGRKGVIEAKRDAPFMPKLEHILQSLIYLDFYTKYGIKNWIIFYIARDNGFRAQHWMEVKSTEDTWESPRTGNKLQSQYPVVNDVEMPYVTTKAIYERYEQLWNYLNDNKVPPRDFTLQYSKETLEQMVKDGTLSKTDSDRVNNDRFVEKGDWNCSYCAYKSHCWKDITIQDLYEGRADKNTGDSTESQGGQENATS